MLLAIAGAVGPHGNESALNALSVAVLIITFGLFAALSIHDERARGKDAGRSS
jgi:hypothetical protein